MCINGDEQDVCIFGGTWFESRSSYQHSWQKSLWLLQTKAPVNQRLLRNLGILVSRKLGGRLTTQEHRNNISSRLVKSYDGSKRPPRALFVTFICEPFRSNGVHPAPTLKINRLQFNFVMLWTVFIGEDLHNFTLHERYVTLKDCSWLASYSISARTDKVKRKYRFRFTYICRNWGGGFTLSQRQVWHRNLDSKMEYLEGTDNKQHRYFVTVYREGTHTRWRGGTLVTWQGAIGCNTKLVREIHTWQGCQDLPTEYFLSAVETPEPEN